MSGKEIEITTQIITFDADEAERRVIDRPVAKLRKIIFGKETSIVRTVLRYKPFYEFEATLTNQVFRGDDKVNEGLIIVDAMTGVARPVLNKHIDTETKTVSAKKALDTSLSKNKGFSEANRKRIETQRREKGEIQMNETPRIVYKPVWIVELADGDIHVIDATNGQLFSGMVLVDGIK